MLKKQGYYEDTIASICTSNTNSAISIIRVSGIDSIKIVNGLFKGKNLEKVKANTINYGHILSDNEVIDEVLVSVFKAPKSYTGENTCEINCHGGIYVTNRILELLLSSGCRLAENGEFTKRAFLNGRIDLTQAEAVMDVISATNENKLRLAQMSLRGDVYKLIDSLRKQLMEVISKIEVNIDYPEYEDEEQITNEVILPIVRDVVCKIEHILKLSKNSIILKEGIKTAIIGRPNVGKSSILNNLLKEDRAIVTDIEGTTRDIITETVNIHGVELKLIDTAGIRQTEDIVEKIGVERSIEAINSANLVILVLDNSRELSEEDKKLIELTNDKTRIIVVNKVDSERKLDLSGFDDYCEISALNNDISNLENKIVEVCKIEDLTSSSKEVSLNNARQIAKLNEAYHSLKDALDSCEMFNPIDMINIDISMAYTYLGEIVGTVARDDLFEEMFTKFCLGK